MANNEDNFNILEIARHDMEICNACRYCETLCPVFPEITNFRTFEDNDLYYLSNLCHNCKGCYHSCQYAPPHEFGINIPKTFSELRVASYINYAFPSVLGKLFSKNGTLVSIMIAVCISLVFIAGIIFNSSDSLFVAYDGEGSFYNVIPLGLMSGVSMVVCFHACIAFFIGFKRFWTENGDKMSDLFDGVAWKQSLKDVASLKHLDGGDNGHGCNHVDERFSHSRKTYHQFVMYGFGLTLVSTTIAAIYHYAFGLGAPYDYFSLPVITGTVGGVGVVIGTIGLTYIKIKADKEPISEKFLGMDYAFIALLFFVNLTGLLLLVLRAGELMPILLCIHLGFVLAFFLIMPYCKFVHALYRFGALLKYNRRNK